MKADFEWELNRTYFPGADFRNFTPPSSKLEADIAEDFANAYSRHIAAAG